MGEGCWLSGRRVGAWSPYFTSYNTYRTCDYVQVPADSESTDSARMWTFFHYGFSNLIPEWNEKKKLHVLWILHILFIIYLLIVKMSTFTLTDLICWAILGDISFSFVKRVLKVEGTKNENWCYLEA